MEVEMSRSFRKAFSHHKETFFQKYSHRRERCFQKTAFAKSEEDCQELLQVSSVCYKYCLTRAWRIHEFRLDFEYGVPWLLYRSPPEEYFTDRRKLSRK
jgi:hypothetical protein